MKCQSLWTLGAILSAIAANPAIAHAETVPPQTRTASPAGGELIGISAVVPEAAIASAPSESGHDAQSRSLTPISEPSPAPTPSSVSAVDAAPGDTVGDRPTALETALFEDLTTNEAPGGAPILPAGDDIAQSPAVYTFVDVEPTDWAFQALRNLIDNYGCLSGFPDGAFRGDRAVSRFEFAAGLSACLDQIVEVLPADVATVAQLQSSFAAELNTRVDALEAQVEELRGDQFSSTTQLFGQVIFGVQGRNANRADFFPVDGTPETNDPQGGVATFYSNVQLSLLTRLTRRSLLLLGLQAGEGNSLFDNQTNTALGLTNNIRLAYESDTNFDFRLSDLTYRHLVSDNLALIVGAAGVDPVSVFRGPNRYESAGQGPLSLFAQRNPIISVGNGNTGVGFDWQISDRNSLQGVYSVATAANANSDGLFSGDYVLGFQFTSTPIDDLNLAFNYLHSFSTFGSLGTGVGDDQIAVGNQITGTGTPTTTHAFGATASWDLNSRVTLGAWGGYTTSRIPGEAGSVETLNWMLFANFPDLFKEGNLGGIYIGQPPRIVSSNLRQGQNIPNSLAGGLGDPGGQPGATLHIEAFYRYELTDYLSITPGIIAIFDPANSPSSEAITIGVIRTTFTF
ncbi:MAG: iron uptake porin [Cyanobacteria bacterium]|nr:iron uptake porin [Cyanobacteriota bacterium]